MDLMDGFNAWIFFSKQVTVIEMKNERSVFKCVHVSMDVPIGALGRERLHRGGRSAGGSQECSD